MSRDAYFGTTYDGILTTKDLRVPGYKVYIWNPNRTTISDVVLGTPQSPRYDLTPWLVTVSYNENIIHENNETQFATSVTFELRYDPNATPIPIDETTLLDNAPIKIYQGDARINENDWVPVFTGVLRGNPAILEDTRIEGQQKVISTLAVERGEAFLNTKVTARSYEQGEDVGKVATELAIDFMGLQRNEIRIGFQDYAIGHPQSQVVDIEVMKGLAQILFPVGKKPKFDGEGFLVAADTDLDKAPARIHTNTNLVVSVQREQVVTSINNSVRLLGLDDELTEVVEREKRIAHGTITSGFFEDEVSDTVWFSEQAGKDQGGRRVKGSKLGKYKISSLGDLFGEEPGWTAFVEDDGYTEFGGKITFNTGFEPEFRIIMIATWTAIMASQILVEQLVVSEGLATAAAGAAADPFDGGLMEAGLLQANAGLNAMWALQFTADAIMTAMLFVLSEIGRLEYEILGQPFQNVYQQICATAQTYNLLTEDVREIELRNDWIYDIDVLEAITKEQLTRELVKGWTYKIVIIDDPLLEVDDVLQIEDRKYYITNIRKRWSRSGAPEATMTLTAWRVE